MMIACDLDGTLTFDGRRPDDRLVDVLETFAERTDVRLVLATARSPRCLREWFGRLAQRIDLVCCNGALHLPPGGLPATIHALPSGSVGALLDRLDRAGAGWCAEYGDHFVSRDPRALPWFGGRHRRVLRNGEAVQLEGVLKVSIDDARAGAAAADGLSGVVALPHATGDLDVIAAGVDKSVAVAGLSSSGAADLAVGNDLNDLAMLRAARRAVVVGDGLPSLDREAHVRRVVACPRAVEDALLDAVSNRWPQAEIA
ncbi:HAD family hydrolase [Nocardioides jensenii]|uniref:HAD family hydrolase n=1 Tax=Nocardioides jensenii TaxID=1843 RepID=UPI00082D9265|nr:HAD hydrolase family protein [Nocardioides jensenii]